MKPLVIGVAGGTGSGKSTVARNVAAALGDASVAQVDGPCDLVLGRRHPRLRAHGETVARRAVHRR